jgi:hypothetical protein
MNIAVASTTKFDDLIAHLKHALTLPKGINGGCDPCLSGLDKLAILNEKIINK